MRRLPNIELTDNNLKQIIADGRIDFGSEAMICLNNNPHTVYKIFREPGTIKSTPMSENKYKKILRLYDEQLEDSVQVISTISNKGELIGYETSFDQNDESMLDAILTRDEIFYYLRKSANVLLYYVSKDITYGDVKSDNILINKKNKSLKFCDLDNMQIGELPIDIMGAELTKYYEETLSIDEKADAYMHNLFFLEQLIYRNCSYSEILKSLSESSLSPELLIYPNKVQEIIRTLTNPSSFKGEYAIQYIKK